MPIRPESIHFASEDGTRLHGWYFSNRERRPPKAFLVFFHGNAENLTSHFIALTFLLEEGYDFFIFDYRGYGESEGKPDPEGTVMDGKAALRWAHARAAQFKEPQPPLVVFAQSLGGAIALRSIIDLGGSVPIRWVVADSTFASYRAAAASVMSNSWVTWPFQPLACLLMSDRYAPGDKVTQISPVPLLVIHGDKDPVIDISLGRKLFEKAKEPKEFWLVEGGGHTDAFMRASPTYRQKFIARLNEVTTRTERIEKEPER